MHENLCYTVYKVHFGSFFIIIILFWLLVTPLCTTDPRIPCFISRGSRLWGLAGFHSTSTEKPLAVCHRGWTVPFSERSAPVARYVNRGLLNFRANGWRRGWGGCGSTLNGKPALLCAVVMAGDYRAKQKDWMNAPPQIGRSPRPTSSHRCLSSILDIYYLCYTRERFECFNHGAIEAGWYMAARCTGFAHACYFLANTFCYLLWWGLAFFFLFVLQYTTE